MPSRLSALLFLVLISSCSKPLPTLEGMDLNKWKDDKNGCAGMRQTMEEALQKEHTKLKGLSEMNIIEMLGRPDQNELYKRNQKFFYYYIRPGILCSSPEPVLLRLQVRFNAMGYAQLVAIIND